MANPNRRKAENGLIPPSSCCVEMQGWPPRWVGQNFRGGQVVFLRLAFLGRVPESPQWRRRRGSSHHAATETVVEDLKQFIQDRIGKDAFPFRIEQRQNEAKEVGVTFQAAFFETG